MTSLIPFTRGFSIAWLVVSTLSVFGKLDLRHASVRSPLRKILLLGSGLLLWISNSPLEFALGWSGLFLLPLEGLWRRSRETGRGTGILFSLGFALSTGLILSIGVGHPGNAWSFGELGIREFLVLLPPALLASGIFPFHLWTAELKKALPHEEATLFLMAQPGIALLAHSLHALHEPLSEGLRWTLVLFFLVNSVYRAGMGWVRTNYKRAFWNLFFSQSCLVAAGLLAGKLGVVGATLLTWVLLPGFFVLARVLEALRKKHGIRKIQGHEGLAKAAPRANRFFLCLGLLLIGAPGGLAFVGEDLLFHALLEISHLAVAGFIVATCINGMVFYRVYSRLFLGHPRPEDPYDLTPSPHWDISRRDGVLLTLLILAMLASGLLPGSFLHLFD